LHAECRLHDVQAIRRSTEVALFGDGEKIAQMAQIHSDHQ
jgi:hypothetical protein